MPEKMPAISSGEGRRDSAVSRFSYQVTARCQSWSRETVGRRSVPVYKVAFENANVRALDIHVKLGAKVAMHSHPASVLTAYTPCKMRLMSSDGKSADVEFKSGDIVWRDAETHAGENIGTAECHVLQVELKHAGGAAKKAK